LGEDGEVDEVGRGGGEEWNNVGIGEETGSEDIV